MNQKRYSLEDFMPVLRAHNAVMTQVRSSLARRLGYTQDLMMVVIDFIDGPWPEPELMQQHVHDR